MFVLENIITLFIGTWSDIVSMGGALKMTVMKMQAGSICKA